VPTVLVLGAAGFIGAAVSRAAAADGDEVHCLVRRPAPELASAGKVHQGDARRPHLGLDRDTAAHLAAEVEHVVLAMGHVSFGMSLAEARAAHLAPLHSALAFARTCRQLRSLTYVSSIAAIGDCDHRIASHELPPAIKVRNFYEWTKYEGERLVRRFDGPVRIVRPGQVMNSFDDEQRTPSPLVLFEALPYLASGLPLAVGGHMDYWCAPVDFVADVTLAAARSENLDAVWAIDPASPSLRQILDLLALRHQLGGPRIRNRGLARAISAVVQPRWLDLDVDREVLAYVHATYDLDLSCITGLIDQGVVSAPPDRSYVERTVDHEVARRKELR
jgi:nucleoside-diphosphate-sugar epimerase